MAIATWPDADGARIAERRPRERRSGRGADANHGEIRVGVAADEVRAQRAAVGQQDVEALGALDDVIVRQDEPVGREDDARSAAAVQLDANDRRPDDFDGVDHGARIRVEQLVVLRLLRIEARRICVHVLSVRARCREHTTRTGRYSAAVISFVVPAYNEERLLGRTLAAIHAAGSRTRADLRTRRRRRCLNRSDGGDCRRRGRTRRAGRLAPDRARAKCGRKRLDR